LSWQSTIVPQDRIIVSSGNLHQALVTAHPFHFTLLFVPGYFLCTYVWQVYFRRQCCN